MEYLILHTKLLCKFERSEVHEYVKKDYYPIGECLEICKANKVERAVAELLRRNGNFLSSINAYLDIIDKQLNRQDMISELYSESKGLVSANANRPANKKKGMVWEFLNCQKMPTIQEFDVLLDKAVKVADKQESIVGEEGWFVILESLSKYRLELQDRLYPATVSGGATHLTSKDKLKLDLLKDFVFQRKNLVLKIVPTSISL